MASVAPSTIVLKTIVRRIITQSSTVSFAISKAIYPELGST